MKQVSSTLRAFWMRVRFLFSRRTMAETDEELQFHIERQIEANLAAGMTPEEARRQAVIAFGDVEAAREACSEQRPGWWMMDTVLQDVRYGVRMALGATQADILRLVVAKGMGLVLIGGLAGLIAAFGVSRLVKSLLFSVSAHDPVSFLAVVLVLSFVALLATLIPALAATRVNPNVALRCE